MKKRLRLCMLVVVSIGIISALGYFASALLGHGGDANTFLDALDLYVDAAQLDAELEEHRAIVCEGQEEKLQIVRELLAGNITLLDAAAGFEHVHEELPEDTKRKFQNFPGQTRLESRCREVMGWVRGGLLREPARRTEVLGHLESELQMYLLSLEGTPSTSSQRQVPLKSLPASH